MGAFGAGNATPCETGFNDADPPVINMECPECEGSGEYCGEDYRYGYCPNCGGDGFI